MPEVEITAPPDGGGGRRARESALAPGLVALKTFDPPLDALAGRELDGVRRIGKMLAVEAGDLTLLVHLMSAGRLQLFDARSLRDRASRILVRLEDGRELRLREFGTQQRAWAKLLPADAVAEDEAVATLGPDAYPPPPLGRVRRAARPAAPPPPAAARPATIAGIGRSWVDELLWTARLSPFQKGSDLDGEEVEALHAACDEVLGGALDALRGGRGRHDPGQDADAAQGAPPGRRGVPPLRHPDRGDPLQGLRHVLLPGGADGWAEY